MVQLRFKTKEEFKEKYTKEANFYDSIRSTNFEGKQVDRVQLEFLLKNFKFRSNRKVLEAGCGTGRLLLPLAKKGFECYGIDPVPEMLNILRNKAAQSSLKVNVKKGDIENIPFKSDHFDYVYSIHVLMHMPDYKKSIKEMYRVLKPGGTLIADFPNFDSSWTKLSLFLNPNKLRTQLFRIVDLKHFFEQYDYEFQGLFSYPRTVYKLPLLRHIFAVLNSYLPLPVVFRTQLIVIVRK